ncbi:tetratricopeptide repeat protein [uncultured Winogradskyella sp.]|uniref:tetratricopeptide repeat protein n=1 Tax=uncultured Winogradskyella sp. TaxID=395353 RepID=UPI00262EE63D|nr:tetratricopeptide repeat protein [uncultured Winogradskyella sp.]
MKLSLYIICFLFIGSAFSQNQLSTEDWQEDLRYLQAEVHKNYSHLFKKVTAKDFDVEVEELFADIPNMEPHEINVAFSRIVSLFKYGHTQITFHTVAERGILPVNLYHFNDGIFIEGVMKLHRETLGAKVLKVEGVEVEEALKRIRPVVPAENDQYFKAYGLRFLTVPDVLHAQGILKEWSKTVTLTLEKDNVVFDYEFPTIQLEELSKGSTLTIPNENWLSARDQSKTPLYLKDLNNKYYYFEYLKDSKILYVRQSSVFDDPKESLKDFYKRLFTFIDSNTIDKLVYDVRGNGGGNNYNNLQFIKGLMARPKINTKGKFFYIIGRETFSAAQNLTNEISRYTEAILVGEPTAENINFYGDARRVVLPKSGINAYLSYAWWQDEPQWENQDATLPHVAVDMSFNEYKNNADPVLEAALNYKDDGFILKPMQHLTELFMSGNFTQLKTDAIEIANNPKYRYYDFENEFGKAGGRLFLNGNVQGAIFIYQLLTEVYPDSAGHFYNLGSALEKAEQADKAIEVYEMLVKNHPKHMLSRAAKKRIEALKKE